MKRYQDGELTLDVAREEAITESELKIDALKRKVGPLTRELELLNGEAHRRPRDDQRALVDHLRAGGIPVQRGCRMFGLPRGTYYWRPRGNPMGRYLQPRDGDVGLSSASGDGV
jgi:hypothetical protein